MCLCNSFPVTSFPRLSLSLFLSTLLSTLLHLKHYCSSSFLTSPRTHAYPALQNSAVSFLILLSLLMSVSLHLPQRSYLCHFILSLPVSLNPALSLDFDVFNLSSPGVSPVSLIVCCLLFHSFYQGQ